MIDLNYPNKARVDMNLEEFLAEASLHVARWQSLTAVLRPPSDSPALNKALDLLTTAQPPRLERLRLIQLGPIHLDDPITLFGGAPAPSTLKGIMLRRCQVAIEPLRLSGLVSLSLGQVASISTSQLFEILRGSPLLETLDLVENSSLKAIGSQLSTIQPIELTKLVSLSLTWLAHDGANCILSTMRIPNGCSLSVRDDVSVISPGSILFPAHLIHKTISTADYPSSVIYVEVDDVELIIRFREMMIRLFVNGEDQIQEVLGWLADSLGSQAAKCPVHLKIDFSAFDPVRLAEVPNPLVVKHLSYTAYYNESLTEALSIETPQPTDSQSSGWLLPQLESLSVAFEKGDSQKQLLSMLRSRYGGATLPGEARLGCPTNLRSIELRDRLRTDGLLEEIKGLLGEADVF